MDGQLAWQSPIGTGAVPGAWLEFQAGRPPLAWLIRPLPAAAGPGPAPRPMPSSQPAAPTNVFCTSFPHPWIWHCLHQRLLSTYKAQAHPLEARCKSHQQRVLPIPKVRSLRRGCPAPHPTFSSQPAPAKIISCMQKKLQSRCSTLDFTGFDAIHWHLLCGNCNI